MAFKVLTKKYEVDKCFLSTLHYMVGNNSKNDIYLIDRRTDISDYIDKKESIKKFNVFSICVINKNNNEEGYKCFINMDILSGAIHSFDFSKFDRPLNENQKLSIILCVRFIDALYRTGIGNGLNTKDCMDRVLTLYKYDNSDKNDKHILNVARVKPDQFYSYSTLYDIDTDYIEDIIRRLKPKNNVRLTDSSIEECIVNGYTVTTVSNDSNYFNGAIKATHLGKERYVFVNLSFLDKIVNSAQGEEVREFLTVAVGGFNFDFKINSKEDARAIYRFYTLLYALHVNLEGDPNVVRPQDSLLINIKDFIIHEKSDKVLNCIRIKNK